MKADIVKVDYLNKQHASDLVFLLNAYASDQMGGGEPLSSETCNSLPIELSKLPHAFSLIAYIEGKAVALVNCFDAFSTFNCKPLINIHDVFVLKAYRSKGISQMMLDKVEDIAKSKGCCKLTLEVLSANEQAKSAYLKHGFTDYQLDATTGHAL